jgi:hypothetical protein
MGEKRDVFDSKINCLNFENGKGHNNKEYKLRKKIEKKFLKKNNKEG